MSKIKYDVSDVEGAADLEPAPIGVFPVKITKFVHDSPEDKDDRFVVTAEITDPKGKYFNFTDYIMYASPASKFRWRQFCDAAGLPPKGEVDDVAGTCGGKKIVGAQLQVRVKHEKYNDETRAKVGLWLPKKSGGTTEKAAAEEEAPTDDLDELGAQADNEMPGAIANLEEYAEAYGLDPNEFDTWAELATAIQEARDAGAPEEGGGEDAPENLVALAEAADESEDADAIARLEELAAEAGLDPNEYDTWEELVGALETSGGPEEEAGGDEDLDALAELLDSGEEGEEADAADARLRELADPHGIDPDSIDTWADVVEAIRDAESGGGSGGGEDYDAMSLVELKKLCKERELSVTGKREDLVERLSKYEGTDPFTD